MDYTIDTLPSRLTLGRQTETGVTDIRIDMSEWLKQWPELTISIWPTRPGEKAAYPADTYMDGSAIIWRVNNADTAIAGSGTVQIMGVADGQKKLSKIMTTYIANTTTGVTTVPPAAAQPWADGVAASAASAQQAAQRAEDAAGEIKGISAIAQTLKAGQAATAEYANGVLRFGIPAGERGVAGEQGAKGEQGPKGDTGPQGEPGKDAVVDATLSQSGQAADAKVTGDALSKLKGDLAQLEDREKWILLNGIDYNNYKDGKYYGSGGTLLTSDAYVYSEEYIAIKPNTLYQSAYYNGSFKYYGGLAICFYDKNKTFISQHYNTYNFTSPPNAKYVRISTQKIYSNKCMWYESNGNLPTEYNQFGYTTKYIEEVTSQVEEVTSQVEEEQIVQYTDKTNKYFKTIEGTDRGEYDNWSYVTYEVSVNEEYIVSAVAGQDARLWLMFDNDDNVLSYSTDSSMTSAKTERIKIIPRCTKLVVNNAGSKDPTLNKLLKNYTVPSNKVLHNGITLSELLLNNMFNNILYGKTLVCCGDSITWGADMEMGEGGFTDTPNIDCYWWTPTSPIDGSFVKKTTNVRMPYGYQIASRNGMTFFDAGISGSTMQGLENKYGFSLENGRYTKLPDSIDYLCIFFGWNDAAYGTLGTIDDTTNESYYGGYNVVLPYLINKYPYTKICLIVPFGCTANHRNAIRLLANKWGVACFDMYKSGTPLYFGKESDVGVNESIVTLNKAKFQANGAHPNYQGHNQISVMLENFLRGI